MDEIAWALSNCIILTAQWVETKHKSGKKTVNRVLLKYRWVVQCQALAAEPAGRSATQTQYLVHRENKVQEVRWFLLFPSHYSCVSFFRMQSLWPPWLVSHGIFFFSKFHLSEVLCKFEKTPTVLYFLLKIIKTSIGWSGNRPKTLKKEKHIGRHWKGWVVKMKWWMVKRCSMR